VAGVRGFVGTLLGPGTTSSASVWSVVLLFGGLWVAGGVGVWCFCLAVPVGIPACWSWLLLGLVGVGAGVVGVDASIFVAKFLRAHGGCLGIRSR
jgi:hypothetical protein